MQFLWSDAWLLAALFWARRATDHVELEHLLAYGDAINHAVFNPDELESGLARLAAANLVAVRDGSFVPNGRAMGWYEEFSRATMETMETMNWLAQKLPAEAWRGGVDPRNNLSFPGFSFVTYEEAVVAYQRRGNREMDTALAGASISSGANEPRRRSAGHFVLLVIAVVFGVEFILFFTNALSLARRAEAAAVPFLLLALV